MTNECEDPVVLDSAAGRWLLAAAVMGAGLGFLDGTVVNVAVRRIGSDLDASLAELQWVLNAYLLALASLILVGGSLGDRLGRKRVFTIGVVWFAVASLGCAVAPDVHVLIAARAVQGIGAALVTPGSLAMMQGSYVGEDRARAIGMWSGLTGVFTVIGPFLGGGLVQSVGWRYVFWINVPIAVAIVVITLRHVPESRDPQAARRFDLLGAALGAVGLGGVTYALIEAGSRPAVQIAAAAVIGVVGLGAFVASQRRRDPMVPPSLFTSRVFTASNLLTFVVYGALGALTFLLVLQLQVVTGFGPLAAGLATLPITVFMLALSGRSAALASRIGPRLQMSLGPALCAVGAVMLVGVDGSSSYWTGVLPGMVVFALGLTCLVAPLTATVLAAAPDRWAGIASGVNNAVARIGSLLAVAALPVAVGLSGDDYDDPAALTDGYRAAMLICAALLLLGGAAGWLGLRGTRVLPAEQGPA
ncbi:MFS transporter [Nocardioides sp. DS6]|uniref:MFS transporter n=1 Tax=Nocardioides eburneus TaxID=3231482 RepID=A0ABV3SUB1_9ACTN